MDNRTAAAPVHFNGQWVPTFLKKIFCVLQKESHTGLKLRLINKVGK